MDRQPRGYFAVEADCQGEGQRYAYALDGETPRPDPLSRWQPEGISGPSAVFDAGRHAWGDRAWKGVRRDDLVVSEVHVGTFTQGGTFLSALERLPDLLDVGITCVELMPVGQFPGVRNWGYDGVFPFAVQNSYGAPGDLQRFVDECHRLGLAVILDVIFNHFGPEGNVFPRFGPYLSDRTKSDWGPAVNYDGKACDPVRAMVLDNVRMWVREFHVDGLRIDAADQIYDRSPRHILSEMAEVAHEEADRRGFPALVFGETDQNDATRYLNSLAKCGYGLDVVWNDDFHHAAHVVLTGETNGYYADFADGPSAMAKAFERVYVNDGNYSRFRDRRHGAPAIEFPGDLFLAFTQNHDQIGNRLKSDRHAASVSHPAARLGVGLLLLAPRIPLLFQGQEYGETNPFPFFCDFHDPELIRAVRDGRKAEFASFGWDQEPPDPLARSTRDMAVLSWRWDDPFRSGMRALTRDLIAMRRGSSALRDFQHPQTTVHGGGAVLEVVRGSGLRIVFNLAEEARPIPDPLQKKSPSFRSEVANYASAANPVQGVLSPREFQVFGDLA
jgi:maltooligosyltrehalose trehalohydrolase